MQTNVFDFILEKALYLIALVISFTVHEFSHGYSAYLLGDDLAKKDGRLTLNPLKHMDPLGTLMFLILGFGWAKPVRFNPENFKNRIRDSIITALAGPFSNLLLSLISIFIIGFVYSQNFQVPFLSNIINFLNLLAVVNIVLMVFNLIPIPPLDGSHLYMSYLAEKNISIYNTLSQSGFVILIIMIFSERITGVDLLPIVKITKFILNFMTSIILQVFN